MGVEALDLGRDNAGPLAELFNLDKGLWVSLSKSYARYW
jgi:hypothetical protein